MDIYSYHHFIFMRLLFPLIPCLLLFLLPLSLSYNLLPLCHQQERVALMQFKDSFIIQNNSYCEYSTTEVASWKIDGNNTNCCAWDGVECNQDTGHVIALNLWFSCLYGSITSNSSLFLLLYLQNLTLANNDFNHSQIPSKIGNLSSLTYLDLSDSQFSGQIPSEIQYLSKLSYLRLHSSFDDLYTESLTSLVQNLTNLKSLFFYGINISSTVPESLANLSSLQILSLIDCGLYGQFPSRIFHLPHLQGLYLLANEDLTGHLPEFHTNSPLKYLILDDTNFSGNLPASIGNLNSLTYFYIQNCNFSGTIPNSFSNLTQLTSLGLRNNMIHGSLPIPPPSLGIYLVSNNSFTGRISPFICNMSSPEVLDLSHNYLSGLIHPCMGNLSQSLTTLVLRSNNLGNTIPKTWPKGCSLKMIDLSQNQLQGHLPRSLANCTELEYLRVSSNQFSDTSPFWLGTLQHLKILDLHSNGFYGAIRSPETNYTFPNLCIIDLSHNHFSGNLPAGYFAQWDAMKSIGAKGLHYMQGYWDYYSIIITIKGVELEYKKIQDDLRVIDFSCNRFEGDIPEILGNLEGLHALNLSNNDFTSHIPSSFANLTQLESLDLSRNKLFRKIPPEFLPQMLSRNSQVI
ncbi:receptor-like protein 43 isoform X2 [Juglans regia]|uniref:Receptor-like protein 43 isoform X2 n=1 Tax=Juglans regia TaxID=51240 RepID=A0A6P9ESA9_JUGRE|nr:receptor-like protein 43 isoform X2 [Juglans regia]